MAFPLPETEVQVTDPINDDLPQIRDLSDLDGLLKELNTPKEFIESTKPDVKTAVDTEHHTIEAPELNTVSDEEAEKSGDTFAKMLDVAVSTGLTALAKEKEKPEKYRATPSQLKDLSDACKGVSKHLQTKFPPVLNLILIFLVIYLPKFFDAKRDREINSVKIRQDEQERKQTDLKELVEEQKRSIDELNKRILEIQGLKPAA